MQTFFRDTVFFFSFFLVWSAPAAEAQQRVIVGNTLVDIPPGVMLANGPSPGRGGHGGKGHGRGSDAPAPAPAVSAPTPTISVTNDGRGEASFQQFPAGSVVITPVQAQAQPVQPQPLYTPPQLRTETVCPECGQTQVLTVPLQLHLRASVQTVLGQAVTQQAAPAPCR